MPAEVVSRQEFIRLFESIGATEMARQLGIAENGIYKRRRYIEKQIGRSLNAPSETRKSMVWEADRHPERVSYTLKNGIAIVGSDAHYWPGIISTAHRAFVKFCKEMQPDIVVLDGDMFDGARISRHAPIGWETKPSVIQEIEAVQERTSEIVAALPKKTKKAWALGNHDARFESRLATVAPEYAKVHGMHLKDHLPFWEPCWAAWINPDESGIPDVVIKHRYKGGEHAAHNNTIRAGTSIVTGHDHTGKVTPFTDYRGTRWGVSLPTMAEPYGPQFVDYTEDNPRNHRSGFAVLTFKDGRLLPPEIVFVSGRNTVDFRGEVLRV
jgi:hypothetical protein